MCPPAASTPVDIDFTSSDEKILGSLERIIRGSHLPSNVIDEVNPYSYMPTNLPERVWYFVSSKENTSAQHGQWKAEGETCEIFSNSGILGWKTTLEFYEGQFPHERKTGWIMQKFSITQEKECENGKDSSSLCRVFLSGRQSLNHDKQLNMSSPDITSQTHSYSTQIRFAKDEDDTRQGSTSKPQVNDDNETRALAVMDGPTNHSQNLPEIDDLSEGDFLELRDLDDPASPSSSSDNSSCMTMSSDEYFDSGALLGDLEPNKSNGEPKNSNGVGSENAGHKYSFSAFHRPDKLVTFPGSLMNVQRRKHDIEKVLKTKCFMPGTSMMNELDSKSLKQAIQGRKVDYRDEGPSSNVHNLPLSSHGNIELQNGEKKATVGRMKKLKRKYFCFVPF